MTERYQNGKIYKLVSDKTDLIYIGSTCLPLHKRLYQHKEKKNNCSSKQLFELGGKVEIVLIEEFPTESKDKLFARERWHIENNNCVNKFMPIRDEEERQECHRKAILKYKQSEKGKEVYKAAQKRFQQTEKGKAYRKRKREKQVLTGKAKEWRKKYRESEKVKAAERAYHKKYYQKRKLAREEQKLARASASAPPLAPRVSPFQETETAKEPEYATLIFID